MRLRSAQRGPPPRLGFAAFALQAYTCQHAKPRYLPFDSLLHFGLCGKPRLRYSVQTPRDRRAALCMPPPPPHCCGKGTPLPHPLRYKPRITRRPTSFETRPSIQWRSIRLKTKPDIKGSCASIPTATSRNAGGPGGARHFPLMSQLTR